MTAWGREVYNRLHTRDELVFCPSCRRILYIPTELPPELAVHKPKERKERAVKAPPAAVGRQTSAVDVLRSVDREVEETPQPAPGQEAPEPEASGQDASGQSSPPQPQGGQQHAEPPAT